MRAFMLHKTLGSILLIAGTAIGAGMLALPIATGMAGFKNAVGLLVAGYLFMLLSLFVLLEVNLGSKKANTNIISMAGEWLGRWGQLVAWITFLLLLYAVAAAYISGGGSLILPLLHMMKESLSPKVAMLIFMALFGFIAFFDTRHVDVINKVLMLTLIVAFFFLLFFMMPHVEFSYLNYSEPKYLWSAVPIVILSFTSHLVVPSLRSYLGHDVKQLRRVLALGSLIPIIFYVLWELMILGVVPAEGPFSIQMLATSNSPVGTMTRTLKENYHLTGIAMAVGVFSFCALVTSFLAVMLSLFHFLEDGFKDISHLPGARLWFALMAVIPPLLFALYFPRGFLMALSYAGVFVAVLYGILPALMAWRMRTTKKELSYRAPLGKLGLLILLVGSLVVIYLQIADTLNWLPKL